MHITHPASGVMVTTGIVGSGMPIANGLALAAQMRGEKRVDRRLLRRRRVQHRRVPRSAEHGRAVEAAGRVRLPEQPLRRAHALRGRRRRRSRSPIARPATRCRASPSTATIRSRCTPRRSEAIDRARAGDGPTLIEAMTFRFHGHVFGDADGYMAQGREGRLRWRAIRCRAFRAWLIANGHATEAELAAIEAGIEQRDRRGRRVRARRAPYPDVAELRRDVFAEEVARMKRRQPGQADEHDPGRQPGAGRGDGARPERDPARRGHRRRGGGRRRRRHQGPVDQVRRDRACAPRRSPSRRSSARRSARPSSACARSPRSC